MLQKFRVFIVMICLFLALVLGLVTVQVMVAGVGSADLSGSTLSVDKTSTVAGGSLQYTAVISNSGDTAVNGVIFTDTLPAEVTYQANSFASFEQNATTIGFGDTGNVITWTGDIDGLGSVSLSYSADVTDTVMVNDIITNTINITGTGELIIRTASTTIVDEFIQIVPMIGTSVPAPMLDPIQWAGGGGSSWILNWSAPAPNVTAYQVQQANTVNFVNPVAYDLGNVTTGSFNYTPTFVNLYCFRVRALVDTQSSVWSNVQCAYGNYYDDMSNSGSGWSIRQEDTDDSDNFSYYENGEYIIKISGRWDYAIGSPLTQAPKPPYAIESRITFDPTVDNLHAYGIIFGGNWNGQPCPNSNFTSCFTHYYRMLVIWYGPLNSFRVELKRIDYNDPDNNSGRGVTLDGFNDVFVGNSKGYNNWRIEVGETGLIRVFLNGSQVLQATDASYINDPYFGIFAASNEYLGSEPHVDWFRVTKQ